MHATLCDIIADLVQNSIEAGSALVELRLHTSPETIDVVIADNGKGMSAEKLAKSVDPFYSEPGKHDHRRVGLGLPLLLQTVEATGGRSEINSTPGQGTVVKFSFDPDNFDTPPIGDLPATLILLMASVREYELVVNRSTPADAYVVKRSELLEALGDLATPASLILARDYMRSQEDNLIQ